MSKYLGMKYNFSPEVHKVLDQGQAEIAKVAAQAEWVVGHCLSHEGNQSYLFPLKKTSDDIAYVISHDIDLPPLYGRNALTIIVPGGVNVNHGDLGENRLLYRDGFRMEAEPGMHINLGPSLLAELNKRNFWAEDFIYAEAAHMPDKKSAFNGAAAANMTERALGIVSESLHAPPTFVVLSTGRDA